MRTPKITSLYVALLVLSVSGLTSAFAQNKANDLKHKTPEERAKFQTEMMRTKLNLNAQQQSKIEVINLNYAKKFEPIIKSSDRKITRFKQAMSLQKAKDEELKKVFTTGQYQQYEKFKETLKSHTKR
ncbi:hypothetical protein [Pedobacter alluvionis]|uniref:DUF4890 domain-containing protein n=1 Tax=Pedobacter alluvionis TaxID=475253 RepID=A0A497YGC8_9SPHI|nr:hypothetical protein [Pedobacter alluvionis]RLJ79440.1 hypothetical protein BCL90_0136 [Pedobacter alluvionis]TFB30790.1 hypothetical protein E3V97_09125 [Pedobacter alluvionis]